MLVNSPIYWARAEGWVTGKRLMLESMVKWSCSGICLTPQPHLRRWGFCIVSNTENGTLGSMLPWRNLSAFFREWLHRREGAGELLQGVGNGPERSRRRKSEDTVQRIESTVWSLPRLSPVFFSFFLFIRIQQTPHSEKRWKSSCRSLTKTKMGELRCLR